MKSFEFNKKGMSESVKYLNIKNKMIDFWYHPSSYDIIQYANKLLKEENEKKFGQ